LAGDPSRPVLGDLSLLEELPGAALILEMDGTVLFMNRLAESRLELPRAETIGRDFFAEAFPDLDGDGLGERFRIAMSRHPASFAWDAAIESVEGSRSLAFGARSCRVGGRLVALIAVEDRSSAAREGRRRAAAERLATIGELAAGAAHEINNPLAAIRGFAQLLSEEVQEEAHREALAIISRECSRVSRVVDNLLAFAAEQHRSAWESIDLTTLVERVVSLKLYGLESSGIQVEAALEPGLSPVLGESGSMQRMVLILVNHAERSLLNRPSERRLSVRTLESNDGVVLYVVDNGPGIPRPALSRLLEQGGEREGGLGLYVAESVIREHGGTLHVESGAGGGTTYCVRLPRGTRPVPRPTRTRQEPSAVAATRVLVADDEPSFRMALSLFLRRHGYHVQTAENADEAYRLAMGGDFDVALVDARMPGDGLSVLSRLAETPAWAGRTILMTGDHSLTWLREENRSGFPRLIKPFDMMEAVRLIEQVNSAADPRPN
jgi:two-component system, cell cycle sensor histidine kinase and response regulator CckA